MLQAGHDPAEYEIHCALDHSRCMSMIRCHSDVSLLYQKVSVHQRREKRQRWSDIKGLLYRPQRHACLGSSSLVRMKVIDMTRFANRDTQDSL